MEKKVIKSMNNNYFIAVTRTTTRKNVRTLSRDVTNSRGFSYNFNIFWGGGRFGSKKKKGNITLHDMVTVMMWWGKRNVVF